MFDQTDIQRLFLKNNYIKDQWENLLLDSGIQKKQIEDFQHLDQTLGIYHKEKLVGTVSYQNNVIKYIAVSEKYKDGGHTFNVLVSAIIHAMSQQEIFHYIVFTKPRYQKSFNFLGFETIVSTPKIAVLEMGDSSIKQYLERIPKVNGEKIAAIVMNANPFTEGHYYLVKQSANNNDWVYVFVLEKEQNLFSTKDRLKLVQQGLQKLKNVIVLSGGEYIISPATFPTYFLREDDEIAKEQMVVDATLFKERIATYLDISARYVGEEPLSPMTRSYNDILETILPPEIKVHVLARKKTEQHQVISASQVRKAYLARQLEKIKYMVPETTYQYLKNKRER